MVRGHMDKSGARIGGDEIAGQERARPGEKPAAFMHRVAGNGSGEVGAFPTPLFFNFRSTCARCETSDKFRRDQNCAAHGKRRSIAIWSVRAYPRLDEKTEKTKIKS